MIEKVIVRSPATVANMVCGFDILGFALSEPADKLVISRSSQKGMRIVNQDPYELPVDPAQNAIGAALLAMLAEVDEEAGFLVESTKVIKPGSGIGSSAASAAGAVAGANRLLGERFSKQDLLRFAMAGEEVASGARHADNIAPCLYGGVTLVRSAGALDIVSIPAPSLFITILHPQLEVRTSEARKVLKQELPLKDAVRQWGNVAGLVAGLMKSDYDLIARSLEDVVAEPARSAFIPGFYSLKESALAAGALGGGISGSGPSVFMLSRTAQTAYNVEWAMRKQYEGSGIPFNTYVTTINKQGITITNAVNHLTIQQPVI